MAHKLAEVWTVYAISKVKPHKLTEKGSMDLTTMSRDGVLTDGKFHEKDTASTFTITGNATEDGGVIQLSLDNKDRPKEHWRGILIYERGDRMNVGGIRVVDEKLAAQDEEPRLITNP